MSTNDLPFLCILWAEHFVCQSPASGEEPSVEKIDPISELKYKEKLFAQVSTDNKGGPHSRPPSRPESMMQPYDNTHA